MTVHYFDDDNQSTETKTEEVEVFNFYRNYVVCYLKHCNEDGTYELKIPLNRLLSIEEEVSE